MYNLWRPKVLFFSIYNHHKCLSNYLFLLLLNNKKIAVFFSVGTVFRRQKQMFVDVRFWRLKTVPAGLTHSACRRLDNPGVPRSLKYERQFFRGYLAISLISYVSSEILTRSKTARRRPFARKRRWIKQDILVSSQHWPCAAVQSGQRLRHWPNVTTPPFTQRLHLAVDRL